MPGSSQPERDKHGSARSDVTTGYIRSGLDDTVAGTYRHTGWRVIVADAVYTFRRIDDIGIVTG